MAAKRKDSKGRILRKGEGQRKYCLHQNGRGRDGPEDVAGDYGEQQPGNYHESLQPCG